MDTVIRVHTLDVAICISHGISTLEKGMNPSVLSPVMDLIVGPTDPLKLCVALSRVSSLLNSVWKLILSPTRLKQRSELNTYSTDAYDTARALEMVVSGGQWKRKDNKRLDLFTEVVSVSLLVLYCHLQHHNDTIIKTQEDFFINICTSHFIVRVRKGLLKVCMWEGVGDRTELKYFDPHSYGRQCCVFLVLQGFSTGSPEAHSAGWWLSLLHLISIFSGPQLIRAPRPLRPDVTLPTTSRLSPSLTLTATLLTSVLTELYNSSKPTQSPIRSSKSHVWSSSSGNNCHPVHRSLSSGASVYECTMGIFFTSSHSVSQFPPTWFPLLTAIRMCRLLPVHYLGMAFLAGSKAKI